MPRPGWLVFLFLVPLWLPAAEDASIPVAQLISQGDSLKDQGDFEGAAARYQEAVARDPASAQALFKLGGVQLVQQDYSDSIESFQRSLLLDQENANAFVGMAVAYLHMGSYKLAEAALEEAARIDPGKRKEVEKVQAWIDQRTREEEGHHGAGGKTGNTAGP